MLDIVAPVFMTATTPSHLTTFFARPYDLKAGSLKDRLQAARPTVFLGVPLVWEKIADKMRAIGASTTGVKKAVATMAKAKNLQNAKARQLGSTEAAPFLAGVA